MEVVRVFWIERLFLLVYFDCHWDDPAMAGGESLPRKVEVLKSRVFSYPKVKEIPYKEVMLFR